jgi:hypothetical protein
MRNRLFVTSLATALIAVLVDALAGTPVLAAPGAPPNDAALCAILPRQTLRIRLVIEPDVPQDLRTLIESTVATVWRGEGLSIDWRPPQPADSTDRTTHFWLRVTTRLLGRTRNEREQTLGVVRFFGDLPHHDVLVSWTAAREWSRLERVREHRSTFVGVSRHLSLDFGGYEELARRAVAYAAAHEVGHFVLGLKSHDGAGLMRRDLVARVVASVEDRDLILSDKSRRRLQQRLVQGAACARAGDLGR